MFTTYISFLRSKTEADDAQVQRDFAGSANFAKLEAAAAHKILHKLVWARRRANFEQTFSVKKKTFLPLVRKTTSDAPKHLKNSHCRDPYMGKWKPSPISSPTLPQSTISHSSPSSSPSRYTRIFSPLHAPLAFMIGEMSRAWARCFWRGWGRLAHPTENLTIFPRFALGKEEEDIWQIQTFLPCPTYTCTHIYSLG